MSLDATVLVTVLGMAVVTYATRLAGFALVVRLPLGRAVRRFLERIPGTTFAALTAPLVVAGGPPEWLAAAVTIGVMRLSRNVAAAILCYVAVVAGVRALT